MFRTVIRAGLAMSMASLFATSGHVAAQEAEANVEKVYVKMSTSLGDLYIELAAEEAPITVENFLAYAKAGHFEGTIFHRVIAGFMAQGGGFLPDYAKKEHGRDPIRNEANNGLKNKYGTLAMARTGDPHSATAQFFINCADNAFLDHKEQTRQGWGYCVFGKIAAGTATLEKITSAKVKFDAKADRNSPARPVEPIVIKSVVLLEENDEGFAKAKQVEAELLAKEEEKKKMAAEYAEKIKEQAIAFYEDSDKGTTTDSGLRYLDVEVGEGAQPKENGKVTVHYSGWLVDGKKFDSSRDRGQTISFPLNGVIKGWGEGVGSMKVGGKRILVIPPSLGYGENDNGPIPGNSTLIFEVELVDAQ